MKHSAKVMSLAMALSITNAMVPKRHSQTQPANPPAATQPANPQAAKQDKHPNAKGAAAGAVVGAAAWNAAARAVIEAGHSQREARRANR